jgi:hypothetical protein
MRYRCVVIVGSLIVASISHADEATLTDCRRAVDAVQVALALWPATDPTRLEVEHQLRLAQGEAGSAEFDECLEIAETAQALLEAEKSRRNLSR